MLVLGDRGEPVDLVTVTSELANTDLLEEVGGVLPDGYREFRSDSG